LEIKTDVTFIFADITGGCNSASVFFNASRTIDVEADFHMIGVDFGNPFTGCTGTYGVFWYSHGDISVKQSQYPLFGAFVADQKVDIERENVVFGCLAGFTGVHVKGRVDLFGYGTTGCTCNQLSNNNVSFIGCGLDYCADSSTFDFTTANSITLTQIINFGLSSGGFAYSVSICLGGDTETCVAQNLPYTTIASGTSTGDNMCATTNYVLSPGTYSMTIYFNASLQVQTVSSGYVYPNAGITIEPSSAGTGDLPSNGFIGFQGAFSSADANECGTK